MFLAVFLYSKVRSLHRKLQLFGSLEVPNAFPVCEMFYGRFPSWTILRTVLLAPPRRILAPAIPHFLNNNGSQNISELQLALFLCVADDKRVMNRRKNYLLTSCIQLKKNFIVDANKF